MMKQYTLIIVCVLCLGIGVSDAWSSPLDLVEHSIDKVKELDDEDKEMCPSPSQNATQELGIALLDLMLSVIDAVHDLRDLSDRADKVYALSTMLREEGLSLIQSVEMERGLQRYAANRRHIEESNKQLQEQGRRPERAAKEAEVEERRLQITTDYEARIKERENKESEEEESWERWGQLMLLTAIAVLLFAVVIPAAIVR